MFTFQKTLKPLSIFTKTHRLLTTVNLPEPPSSAAYDDLIHTAGHNRDFTTVHHLLTQRHANGFFTTTNTFNFISTDLSILTDVIKTISNLKETQSRKKAYESLISRLCKLRLVNEALTAAKASARACEKTPHVADASTFYPILRVTTRRKDFKQGWHVMDIMKEYNIARDVTCYNFFLTAYSVVGDLRSNVDVLRRMDEEGITADARTYDALVLGACKVGKMDGAMDIMRRMEEDGVEALYATYAHVIGGLVRVGYCAQAVEFVMGYGGKDKKLDEHNFGLLATRLIGKKKVDEVKFVLEEMVKRELDMGENLQKYYHEYVNVK